jgi:chromate reductase, NAD(P)H dehydrogenase (quinone)
MAKLKLGVIVGSIRRDSINRKLANALIKLGANDFDAAILQIDDLPLFNQDNENPPPEPAARFKREVAALQALLFVTPEHSRSIPAALKNAIDWGGRPYGTSVWPGKPSAVIGTSPGAIGTAIAQQHLRSVLGFCNSPQMNAPEAYIQFKPDLIAADFSVPDETVRKFLQAYLDGFAKFAGKLA